MDSFQIMLKYALNMKDLFQIIWVWDIMIVLVEGSVSNYMGLGYNENFGSTNCHVWG